MTEASLVDIARSHSLADLLRRTAARLPDKTAVVDGAQSFTFAEFHATVERLAAALDRRGVRQGDRLALLSHNCWQFAALDFATARLGVVLVPINFMLKADEIAFVLEHSGASAFVVEDALVPTAEQAVAASGMTIDVRAVIALDPSATPTDWDDIDAWTEESGEAPAVHVRDDDPVRLMYTSGTESRPKGVLLSSRSLISQYVSCIVDGGMAGDDVDLHTLPMYHCAQLDCFLGPDVYLGATSHILRGPDPSTILRTIETERITKFFAPPTVWISLLRSPDFDGADLSSLRKGYYGASAMPAEVLREIQTRLPGLRLWNFYGQTELSPVATILQPEDQTDHPSSAGRPVLNVETRVVDDENRPVPTGTVGEVVHRSPHAALGYWQDPAKTAEAFADGWFHSGDLGVFDEDGRLRIVDRKKDMIKTGGENVASREVEEFLYLHPDVAEVAVFAVPDAVWVEAVTAVVVPRPGTQLTAESLKQHCAGGLAGYKIPKAFHVTEGLPKNPSGKILKKDLRTHYGAQGVGQETS